MLDKRSAAKVYSLMNRTSRYHRRHHQPASPTRKLAVEILRDVLHRGLPLQQSLETAEAYRKLESRDRRFVRRVITLSLRHHGQVQAILSTYISRPPKGRDRLAMVILGMAVAQLVWGKAEAHATVDQAVRLMRDYRMDHLSGMVNAVLRRIAGDAADLATTTDPAENVPAWLMEAIRSDWPDQCQNIISSLMATPALDIRPQKDPAKWAEILNGAELKHGSVRLGDGHVPELEGYDEGHWWVQDAAASLPAILLGDIRGKTVVDLCAAPGGKTAQLCAAGANVIAVDASAERIERLEENMARLGFSPQIIHADGLNWIPDKPVDAVLIDAPCSATGTLRRRPDIWTHEKAPDFEHLARIQHGLLEHAASYLNTGGICIYATCSILKREGEDIAAKPPAGFKPLRIENNETPGFERVITDHHHMLRLHPHALRLDSSANIPQGNDGFFIARFINSPERV